MSPFPNVILSAAKDLKMSVVAPGQARGALAFGSV